MSVKINGIDRPMPENKKLVVKLCDYMVCSEESCDLSDYTKYRKQQESKKRKSDEHHFHSRNSEVKYKDESTAGDASDVDNTSNVGKEGSNNESSGIEEISDTEHKSGKTAKNQARTRKVIYKEEESKDDFSSEDDPDDANWGENSSKSRKTFLKKKEVEKKEKKVKEKKIKALSSFELMRKKNLDDKMAFLKSLKMSEVEDDLEVKIRKKREIKPKPIIADEDLRKSKRMKNFKINFSEGAMEAKVYTEAIAKLEVPSVKPPPPPTVYSFKAAFCGDEERCLLKYRNFFKDLKISDPTSTNSFHHNLSNLDHVSPILYRLPFTLTSIAFHPAVDRTIILTGSLYGQISLWNKDTEPYLYAPHTKYVTRIAANPACPSQIISSSMDGTLREADLEKRCFFKVFDEDSPCRYFDFLSPTEFLVAQRNGCVSVVDSRGKRSRSGARIMAATMSWKCSDEEVWTISAHPTEKNLCLSLDSAKFLKVWDLRFLGKSAICETAADFNVRSAFFSPVTGKFILASSRPSIRIYGYSHLQQKLHCQWKFNLRHTSENPEKKFYRRKDVSKKHNNLYVGTPNSYTVAHWIPNSDHSFIVCNNFLQKAMILKSEDKKEESHLQIPHTAVFQAVHPVHNTLVVSRNVSNQKTTLQLYLGESCN